MEVGIDIGAEEEVPVCGRRGWPVVDSERALACIGADVVVFVVVFVVGTLLSWEEVG